MSVVINGTTGIDAPGLSIDGAAVGLNANVQEFTSSGTWTKPANAKLVYVEIWGGGGGGASGERKANNTSATGGAGGGGSAGVFYQFRASELTSTVSVTIGAGGAGGAARTTDNADGAVGTAGGDSTFGSYLKSSGATGGGAGIGSGPAFGGTGPGWPEASANVSGSVDTKDAHTGRFVGDAGNLNLWNIFGGAAGGGSYASFGNQPMSGGNILKPGTGAAGGGSGGGFSNTTLRLAGVGGVRWSATRNSVTSTGVGLGVAGAAGANFGDGGAGGGHGRTATAGNGGAGNTAAGGGGGGGSANTFTSGAGGAGGNGFCRVTTYS